MKKDEQKKKTYQDITNAFIDSNIFRQKFKKI